MDTSGPSTAVQFTAILCQLYSISASLLEASAAFKVTYMTPIQLNSFFSVVFEIKIQLMGKLVLALRNWLIALSSGPMACSMA